MLLITWIRCLHLLLGKEKNYRPILLGTKVSLLLTRIQKDVCLVTVFAFFAAWPVRKWAKITKARSRPFIRNMRSKRWKTFRHVWRHCDAWNNFWSMHHCLHSKEKRKCASRAGSKITRAMFWKKWPRTILNLYKKHFSYVCDMNLYSRAEHVESCGIDLVTCCDTKKRANMAPNSSTKKACIIQGEIFSRWLKI